MAFSANEDAKDYATWRQERRSKGSFGINVSTGDAVGFSGIPGKATYNFKLGDKKVKQKSRQFEDKTQDPSGRSSEDKVTGDRPTRPKRTAIDRPIYDGEVVEQGALPDGKKGIENNIIDAEIVETPKAIGGSRLAIEAPKKEKSAPTMGASRQWPKGFEGYDWTTKDTEAAVRKGFVTSDQATGGGSGKDAFKDTETGKTIKPASTTYTQKLGKEQANSQATGKPMGRQFTGPTSMKISEGQSAGFSPYVNLDNIK